MQATRVISGAILILTLNAHALPAGPIKVGAPAARPAVVAARAWARPSASPTNAAVLTALRQKDPQLAKLALPVAGSSGDPFDAGARLTPRSTALKSGALTVGLLNFWGCMFGSEGEPNLSSAFQKDYLWVAPGGRVEAFFQPGMVSGSGAKSRFFMLRIEAGPSSLSSALVNNVFVPLAEVLPGQYAAVVESLGNYTTLSVVLLAKQPTMAMGYFYSASLTRMQ